MKKQYEAPTVEVVEIEIMGPLASSPSLQVHEDEEWAPEDAL